MRRVDEAFSGFFSRVNDGQTPGYPRFKGSGRWNTVGWDEPVGWKLNLDGAKKRQVPHLYVRGVGIIPLSQSAVRQLKRYLARGGVPTTLTLTRVNREGTAWRANIAFKNVAVVKTEPALGPHSVLGIDRGVAVLVAAAADDDFAGDPGQVLHHGENLEERILVFRRRIQTLQAERVKYKKYGVRWRRLSIRIARLHRKAANIVENWARHTARDVVAQHAVIVVEDLNLKAMTKSAKGTMEEPGRNVAAKTGLNRSLLEGAHGKQAQWVRVKAEEAGRRIWGINPANTSRRCSQCTVVDARARVSREVFYCAACGHYEHADVNAARNIRARGLAAETAWKSAGSPLLKRPQPRLRRRQADVGTQPPAG
jgi:putative transposase